MKTRPDSHKNVASNMTLAPTTTTTTPATTTTTTTSNTTSVKQTLEASLQPPFLQLNTK